MTDLQGAIGVEQLKKLEEFIRERDEQASYYQNQLSDVDWLSLPQKPVNGVHAWQAFVTRVIHSDGVKFRNEVMEILEKDGIATRPGTHAIHLHGFYADTYGFRPQDFPNSLLANETTMAIPLHNRLTRDDQDRVINALKKVAG